MNIYFILQFFLYIKKGKRIERSKEYLSLLNVYNEREEEKSVRLFFDALPSPGTLIDEKQKNT